jgi:hypothetical protein
MIAALFVMPGGVYSGLPDVDPWDAARDARTYAGPHPVVAHPPCSAWCQLAPVNAARYGHRVGDDGGCFESALASVRRWGGVLEHPAETLAWAAFGLPRPPRAGWARDLWAQGWVCSVSQRAYGHPARKQTWLYAVVEKPPTLDWSRPAALAWVSYMKNHGDTELPRLTKKQAKATPVPFRDLLLSIARSVVTQAIPPPLPGAATGESEGT